MRTIPLCKKSKDVLSEANGERRMFYHFYQYEILQHKFVHLQERVYHYSFIHLFFLLRHKSLIEIIFHVTYFGNFRHWRHIRSLMNIIMLHNKFDTSGIMFLTLNRLFIRLCWTHAIGEKSACYIRSHYFCVINVCFLNLPAECWNNDVLPV